MKASSTAISAAQDVLSGGRIGFDVHVHLTTKLVEDAIAAAYAIDVTELLNTLKKVVAIADRQTFEFSVARQVIARFDR